RFADGSDHGDARGTAPLLTHALPSVAAPAFDKGAAGENSPANLVEFVLMEPDFGAAVDLVAVIEHEALFVGVEEPVEGGDFPFVPRQALVQIIDEFGGIA